MHLSKESVNEIELSSCEEEEVSGVILATFLALHLTLTTCARVHFQFFCIVVHASAVSDRSQSKMQLEFVASMSSAMSLQCICFSTEKEQQCKKLGRCTYTQKALQPCVVKVSIRQSGSNQYGNAQ